MSYKCPQCRSRFDKKGRFFPFCSERCKVGDLGAWASGKYVIAGDRKDTADETPGEETTNAERKP